MSGRRPRIGFFGDQPGFFGQGRAFGSVPDGFRRTAGGEGVGIARRGGRRTGGVGFPVPRRRVDTRSPGAVGGFEVL